MDENDRYGFIDKTGKMVIPCQWEQMGYSFKDGLMEVMNDNFKHGFIDMTGKVVIPCQWKKVTPFDKGIAKVMDGDGIWHRIDKTGKIIE